MDSPVPASMFAPEPSSPGAARAAAAAARLHGGFDSDCSEDGEALNGEPELDLTSKVGPGGGGAKGEGALRGQSGRPIRLLGDDGGGRGRARPPAGAGARGPPGRGTAPAPASAVLPPAAPTRPPAVQLSGRSLPLGSATWNAGARRRQRPALCRFLRDREGPSLWTVCPWQPRVGVAWAEGAEAREDQVVGEGTGRRFFLVLGKETESSRSVGDKEGRLSYLYFTNPPKTKLKEGHDP